MDSYGLVSRKQQREELRTLTPDLSSEANWPAARNLVHSPVQRTVLLLRRHAWTIVACTLIATSLCLLRAARQPRLYRATADLAIYRDNQTALSLSKDYTPEVGDVDEYTVGLETQLHILQSRSLALDAVRKLRLDQVPGFNNSSQGAAASGPDLNETVSAAESAAADTVLAGLSVRSVKDTRVVEVSFTGPKRELDAKIVNALVDDFIEDSIRSRYDSATRAAKFLSNQLADLRAKVTQSEEQLVGYERKHDIVGVDEKQNVVTGKLDDLNKQLTQAEADRIDKEALYQTIVAGSLDQIPEGTGGQALQSLRLREAELKNEFAQANTVYGPNHPKVLELNNRIKAMDGSIQAELKRQKGKAHEEYLAALNRERKLQQAFNAQKVVANRLNESAIQYGLLKREVDSNRQLYDNLQERMKEAGVAAGLRSSNIRLIDAAVPPDSPVSPNLRRSGSIGLFLGFLLSAAVLGIKEGINRALRDPAEVESFTAMPSLAVIPFRETRKTLDKHGVALPDVVCLSYPRSAVAEAYRALGTSVLLTTPQPRILLVTSPLPGEGKTVTAMNTAVVLAQQGKRVLLVDADLRKPTIHQHFCRPTESGLSSVLLHTDAAMSPIQIDAAPNLFVLSAGPAYPMPAELLGSARMQTLMNSWREQFDFVVVDTPPVLAVTDAIRLSRDADSMLLVMRSGRTTRDALGRACDLLNQARVPVLGIVVNAVNLRSAGPYYYSYYPEISRTYYHEGQSRS